MGEPDGGTLAAALIGGGLAVVAATLALFGLVWLALRIFGRRCPDCSGRGGWHRADCEAVTGAAMPPPPAGNVLLCESRLFGTTGPPQWLWRCLLGRCPWTGVCADIGQATTEVREHYEACHSGVEPRWDQRPAVPG